MTETYEYYIGNFNEHLYRISENNVVEVHKAPHGWVPSIVFAEQIRDGRSWTKLEGDEDAD